MKVGEPTIGGSIMPRSNPSFLLAFVAGACATQPQFRNQTPGAGGTPLSPAAAACVSDFDTLYSIVTHAVRLAAARQSH